MAIIEQRIADNIKQVMGDNISLNALHDKTGIAYNTLKRRVTDGRGIEVYELESIAKALNVDPLDLMKGKATSDQAA